MAGRDLALTTDWDLDLTGGGYLVDGQAAIAQRLKIRAQTFFGEYFLDLTSGLPWLEWSATKMDASVLRQIKLACLGVVQGEMGVVSVDPAQVTATYDRATRSVAVEIGGVTTDTGLLSESVVVEVSP